MNTPTGYDPNETFYATRYHQGGRTVYALDLSLDQVAGLLPAPDPTNPTEGNRKVNLDHAVKFGRYIRDTDHWVAPALVLRAPDIFKFDIRESIAGTDFGVLSFPKMAVTDLRILDGQHRTLGIHLAIKDIATDLEKARSSRATAKRLDSEAAIIKQFEAEITTLTDQRARLAADRVSLQIFIEDDSAAYQQMVYDIAENALGITSSVKVRFDSTKVVNRALDSVCHHSLLKGRVDMEQDRMGRGNPNLLGAKQVAEIIRTIAVGIGGRVGRRMEDELKEDALAQRANDFLDVLIEAFPQLTEVADGERTPEQLRASSMLGSTSMLRILAGVYGELTERQGYDDDDVTEFFTKLAPHFDGPAKASGIWVKHIPDTVVAAGSLAPRSRRQDLKTLHDTLVQWAVNEPKWLEVAA